MDKRLDGYDWEYAFQCCGVEEFDERQYHCRYNEPSVSRVFGYAGSAAGFTRADVAEILAIEDGENDGKSWIGVFKLTDGRFAFLTAGCDYTGWDCQSGGNAFVAGDLESLIRLGLGDDDRARLADQLRAHI